jgi:ATP-dependent Clp protease ATP-binding subunit ClpB
MFKPLQMEEIKKIVRILAKGFSDRLADRQIAFELSDEAAGFIAESAYDPQFGARPLKRFLQRELETQVARQLIGGQIKDGDSLQVSVSNGKLSIISHPA